MERLALSLLLKAPAPSLRALYSEIEDYIRNIVHEKRFEIFLSSPEINPAIGVQEYTRMPSSSLKGPSPIDGSRLTSFESIQSHFPGFTVRRVVFNLLDYPNWFHFLVLTEEGVLSDQEFEDYVSPTLRNRVVYSLDTIRASIRAATVRISLRSRDLTSFLYRSIYEVLIHAFDCQAVSIFYRAESSDYMTLGATTGISEMEQHGLKRTDIKYFLDSKSFTARCYNQREVIVEDIARTVPLHINTLGENVAPIQNRIYFPIKIRGAATEEQPDGLMGVVRIVNAHHAEFHRPIDCVDIYILTYLAELLAVLGNRYLRNISILHDQERATHGFGTDLLTIKLATELNMKHIELLNKSFNAILLRSGTSKAPGSAQIDDVTHKAINLSLTQLSVRSKDIFSIQDHMAEQMVRVLQTKDNYIEGSEEDGDMCSAPYKSIFLRLVGAKEGLAKMFNRKDLSITWNSQDRFDDDLKQLPPLAITNSGMYSIVRNLAENAIKYTQQMNIPRFDIGWCRKEKEKEVLFQFRDWGIGITARDEERLFSEGFRGLEAQRMQLRGNGIGLFLSRDIARRFKGDLLYVRPPDGEFGSIFVLRVRMYGS
jgi:hypothetical protein